MTDFNVGDIVYIKDEYVENYKKRYSLETTALMPGQNVFVQIGLAKDIPLTIIKARIDGFHVTNFTDNWGVFQGFYWSGIECNTWFFYRERFEKREELNTVSLYELNRGL